MPTLESAITRYAAIVREDEFAAEAEASADGSALALTTPRVRA